MPSFGERSEAYKKKRTVYDVVLVSFLSYLLHITLGLGKVDHENFVA